MKKGKNWDKMHLYRTFEQNNKCCALSSKHLSICIAKRCCSQVAATTTRVCYYLHYLFTFLFEFQFSSFNFLLLHRLNYYRLPPTLGAIWMHQVETCSIQINLKKQTPVGGNLVNKDIKLQWKQQTAKQTKSSAGEMNIWLWVFEYLIA